jgi:hypothetical protein
MSKSKADRLAIAVDRALDKFDAAVSEYMTEMHRLNSVHLGATRKPHPIYERAADYVLHAVCSRTKLALILCEKVRVEAIGYTVAGIHQ